MSQVPRPPHPIPYQGSKRRLAPEILRVAEGRSFDVLYEPFAGSAAISLAAAGREMATSFVIGDSLVPLTDLWRRILATPEQLAFEYEEIWTAQLDEPRSHYLAVRDTFNREGGAARLLYLLARCVKNSPRFNSRGEFNQSPDHRRRGMSPQKMRRELAGANAVLLGKTQVRCADFVEQIKDATCNDLVYLDPPWEGTSVGHDRRYHAGLSRTRLVEALEDLDARRVPYILSYDGRHGTKEYGASLPLTIGAKRLELHAGRSSQATLNGREIVTIESLYVSRHLGDTVNVPNQLRLLETA